MHGNPWRHTRASLVGCCWWFSFWRGVFHLYLLAHFPLHIFWEICPLTLLVLSVSIHTLSCSEEAKNDSTAPSDKGVWMWISLIYHSRDSWSGKSVVYFILNKCMKTKHLFEKCTQYAWNKWMVFGGGNGTLLNACKKSCKKNQIHMSSNQRNHRECVLTSAGSPRLKAGKTQTQSIKPSYVTKTTSKMKIKYCPWFISILSNMSKFSQNRSPFYTSDTLCLFLDQDQTLMLFLAPSKKKKNTYKDIAQERYMECM